MKVLQFHCLVATYPKIGTLYLTQSHGRNMCGPMFHPFFLPETRFRDLFVCLLSRRAMAVIFVEARFLFWPKSPTPSPLFPLFGDHEKMWQRIAGFSDFVKALAFDPVDRTKFLKPWVLRNSLRMPAQVLLLFRWCPSNPPIRSLKRQTGSSP